MSYGILLTLLLLVIVARLRLTFRDEGACTSDLLVIGGLPLASLAFLEINTSWLVLLALFPAVAVLMRWTERRAGRQNFWRLFILVVYIVVLGVLCSPLGGLRVNTLPAVFVEFVENVLMPGRSPSEAGFLRLQLYALGLLLVLNEINILLRYLFQILQLEPKESRDGGPAGETGVDEEEYNTGRVIGMLERIFVYIFVLTGQYAAIGFILAAKGVTRFHEFEDRTFAEYVLTGTLLSTLLALFVGYLVRSAAAF